MLFQKNITKKYLAALGHEQTQEAWETYKSYFLNKEIQANILQSKEEQFQEGFLRELFVKVLGYTLNPSPGYNLITEQKNETNAKKADGAILLDGNVIGVIELKDHKTQDLSKIEAQAFGYKSQHKGTRLVVISNFEKLRLYIDNAVEHREWNLFTLDGAVSLPCLGAGEERDSHASERGFCIERRSDYKITLQRLLAIQTNAFC